MNISLPNNPLGTALMLGFVALTAVVGVKNAQDEKANKARIEADPYDASKLAGRVFVTAEKAPIVGGLPRAFYGLVNLVKNVALAAINKAVSLVRKDNAQFVTVRWEAAKLDAQNIKQGLAHLIPSYFKKQA